MQSPNLHNTQIKKLKESLLNKPDLSDLEQILVNTKAGYIVIQKISDNDGFVRSGETIRGWTENFGEGIALYIENPDTWFHTSVIEKINKDTFITKNSEYKYKFTEKNDGESY